MLASLVLVFAAPTGASAAVLNVEASGTANALPCPIPRDATSYADIASAVACAESGDEIAIGEGVWTGPLNRDIEITTSLVLRGAGVELTILDAESAGRHISAGDSSIALSLRNMTLRNGLVEVDPSNWAAVGGSVSFSGETLDVQSARFEDNAVRFTGPGGFHVAGGAIFAGRVSTDPGDQVRISDSVFLRNTVYSEDGRMNGAAIEVGGYERDGSGVGLVIERSAFLDNRSLEGLYAGGAVVSFGSINLDALAVITNTLIASHDGANYAFNATNAVLQSSTLVGFDALALYVSPFDDRISAVGTLLLGLGTGTACSGPPVVSEGYNLDTDGTCGLTQLTDQSNVAEPGVVLVPDAASQPFLALEADSPAVDAGAAGCVGFDGAPLATDQLGLPRPRGAACDIGAIEFDSDVAVLRVTASGTATAAPCPVPRDARDYGDIASAVACAESGDEIAIGEGVWTGPLNRDIEITTSLLLRGAGAGLTILDAESGGRHFRADDGSIGLSMIGMTLRNGLVEVDASDWSAAGGSVLFVGNNLHVADCRFEDNAVRFAGGGSGFIALGGAIAAGRLATDPGDQVRITDSVFVGNTVDNPDGMMRGAAIAIEGYVHGGSGAGLLVERSAFYDNRSLPGLFQGGAVVFFASSDPSPEAFARISNTFISSHDGANHTFGGSRGQLQYSTLVGFDARVLNLFPGDEQVTAVGTMFIGVGSEQVCNGTPVLSEGSNLDTDGSCGLGDPTDLTDVDAPRVTLSQTAEGVPFMLPAADSPAIDAGPTGCEGFDGKPSSVDQLRSPRPRGEACEIGAIEFDTAVFSDDFEAMSPPPD